MSRDTMRCGVCSINWPHSAVYRNCPICGEETRSVHLEDDDSEAPLTEYEAQQLLNPKPTGVMSTNYHPQISRGMPPPKPDLGDEIRKLHDDLERWTKEVPAWMKR